jgi:hypothetical protein
MAKSPPSERVDLSQFEPLEDAIRNVDQRRYYLPLSEKYLVPTDVGPSRQPRCVIPAPQLRWFHGREGVSSCCGSPLSSARGDA